MQQNQLGRAQRHAQYIVKLSAIPDCHVTLIKAGLDLLDDTWLAQRLGFTCLICHQMIFQPCLLAHHLHHEHNHWQFDAQRIHDLLLTIAGAPCYFCELPSHMEGRCVPVFNVAINGHRDDRHLEESPHTGADLVPEPDYGPDGHTPEKSEQATAQEASTSWRSPSSGRGQNDSLKPLVQSLTKLVLRCEDSLNALLSERQFMVFMKTGPGSIVEELIQQSVKWHQRTQKDMPLRHLLATTMLTTLKDRLQKLISTDKTEQLRTDCLKYHIVTEQQTMPFLTWDPNKRRHWCPARLLAFRSTRS